MSGESWLIGISVAVIAIAFVILVIFLIRVLLTLRQSLQNTNSIVVDLEKKVHSFDPLFKAVSNISYAVEKQTDVVKHLAEERETQIGEKGQKFERRAQTVLDIVEWALVGVSFLQKFKKR